MNTRNLFKATHALWIVSDSFKGLVFEKAEPGFHFLDDFLKSNLRLPGTNAGASSRPTLNGASFSVFKGGA